MFLRRTRRNLELVTMGKVIVSRIVGLPVFCQMSKEGHYLSFGPEPQGSNRQKKV